MKPNNLAYSYIRFSSAPQEWGDSERRQEQMAKDHCVKYGLVLSDKSFRDRGISAWKGKNRVNALGELLKTLQPGNTLLIEDNDRLSREDPLTAMNLLHSIVAKGVYVVTLRDGSTISKANFFDLSTFLPNIVKGALANQENEKKSYRSKESWKARRSEMMKGNHRSGKLPFWIKKENGKLSLVPEKAQIVRNIFNLSLNGRGINAILHNLNQNKIPSQGHRAIWIGSTIQRILHSPTVYGLFQPKTREGGRVVPTGEEIEKYYPAVVSKETFLAVQSKIEKRKNSFKGHCNPERVTNLVSGIAKCSKCGSSMVVTDKGRKKYLYCNQRLNNANCVGGGILYEPFEVILLECLGESLANSSCFENKSDTKDLQIKIDAKIQEVKETGKKLEKLADFVLEADAPQVLVQKMKVMEVEQDAMKREIEILQTALLDAQRLPDEYRLLMAAIAKGLKQIDKEKVVIDLNVKSEEVEWGEGPYRSTKLEMPRLAWNEYSQWLQKQISPALPTDRFVLREGFRSMVKKMVVDIAAQTTTTTWPNDKKVKFHLKRERHGNKGNTWFYRTANNDEDFGEWKMIDPARLPQPESRIA